MKAVGIALETAHALRAFSKKPIAVQRSARRSGSSSPAGCGDGPYSCESTQADAIVGQAASGELAEGTAATLLTGLGAVARIWESEELKRRVDALDAAIANLNRLLKYFPDWVNE